MFTLNENSFVISKLPVKYNILKYVFEKNNIICPKLIYPQQTLINVIYNFIKKYAIPNKLKYFILFEDDAWPCADLQPLYSILNNLDSSFNGILYFGYYRLDGNLRNVEFNSEKNCFTNKHFIRASGSQAYLCTYDSYFNICNILENKQKTYKKEFTDDEIKVLLKTKIAVDILISACDNVMFTSKSYFSQCDFYKKAFYHKNIDFNEDLSKNICRTWSVDGRYNMHNIEDLKKILNIFPQFDNKNVDLNEINNIINNSIDFNDKIFIRI